MKIKDFFKNQKQRFNELPLKTKILGIASTIIVLVLFAISPILVKNLSGNIFNVNKEDGVIVTTPSKILVGNPEGYASYDSSSIYNLDSAVITIKNTNDMPLQINDISLSNNDGVSGDDGTKNIQFSGYTPGMIIDKGDTRTIKLSGCLSSAKDYNDATETLTINYDLNGITASKQIDIDFYHAVHDLKKLPLPSATPINLDVRYKGNESETLHVNVSRNSINMDITEDLHDQSIIFTYATSFGNYVRIYAPQSSNSEKSVYGNNLTPRLSDYVSYTKYDDLIEMSGGNITSSRTQQQLYGGTNSITNGVITIYVPVYAEYCKRKGCGIGGYAYNTYQSNNFEGMDQLTLSLNIYDKSALYKAINNLQYKIDMYDEYNYDIKSEVKTLLQNAKNVYNTRVISQADIDYQTTEINKILNNSLATAIAPDKTNLNNLITEINTKGFKAEYFSNTDTWHYNEDFAEIYRRAVEINQDTTLLKSDEELVRTQENLLQNAYDEALNHLKAADYTDLNSAKDKASNVENKSYKDTNNNNVKLYKNEAWSEFETALSEANSCNVENILEQSKVDTCTNNLNNAMNNLSKSENKNKADDSKLIIAKQKASEKSNPEYENTENEKVTLYKTNIWASFEEAYTNAQNYEVKFIDSQSELNNITKALEDALATLIDKNKNKADDSKLTSEIDKATKISNPEYENTKNEKVTLYTTETWQAFQTALTTAQNYEVKYIDSQSELNEITSSLKNSRTSLEKNKADYSELNVAIESAEEFENPTYKNTKNEDVTLYKKSVWDNFSEALDEAHQEVLTVKTIDFQSEINNSTGILNTAMAALTEENKNKADYTSITSTYESLKTKSEETTNGGYQDNSKSFLVYKTESFKTIKTIYNSLDKNLKIENQALVNQAEEEMTNVSWEKYEANYDFIKNNIIKVVFEQYDLIRDGFKYGYDTLEDGTQEDRHACASNTSEDGFECYLVNVMNYDLENKEFKTILTIENQKTVDEYKNHLSDMMLLTEQEIYKPAVGYKKVDFISNEKPSPDVLSMEEYIELINKIIDDNTKVYKNGLYTKDSIDFLEEVLEEIDTLPKYTVLSQNEFNDILITIQYNILGNIEKNIGDYTELCKLRNKIKKLDSSKYLDTSLVNEIVKSIEWDYKIDEQDKIDEQFNTLNEAYKNLKEIKADYTELEKVVENTKNINKSDYVNYNEVQKILNSIKYDLTWSKQDQVDNYAKKLKAAIDGLVKRPADYSALSQALSKIPNNYSKLDKGLVDEINTLLDAYKSLPTNLKFDEQQKIDELVNKLNLLIQKLPKIEDEVIEIPESKGILSYIKVNGEDVDIKSAPFKHTVSYNTESAKISVGLVSDENTYTIYGGKVLVPGDNNVTIYVKDKEGNTYSYVLIITRLRVSNYLSELKIKDSNIEFNKDKQEYTVKIDSKTKRLSLSIKSEDKDATITIKGNKNLKNGSKVLIEVKSSDGKVRVYTLNIQKQSSVEASVIIALVIILTIIAGAFRFMQDKKRYSKSNV